MVQLRYTEKVWIQSTIIAQEPHTKSKENPLIMSTDKRQSEIYFSLSIFCDMTKHFLTTREKARYKL
jgi:hypothetical protein